MARLRDYVFALIFVTAFFSVIMTAVLSTPVFAEDGSAENGRRKHGQSCCGAQV